MLRTIRAGLAVTILLATPVVAATAEESKPKVTPEQVEILVRQVFSPNRGERDLALGLLVQRGEKDVVPALIQALRFVPDDGSLRRALSALTGAYLEGDWHQWMLWQQAHPEIKPFEGFDGFKADLMARIDPHFREFLWRGVEHEIRLEEIAWGGVVKDGIPALNNPELISPAEATYITDDELVFGVEINGDARAYPLRMLDWHEMFNDVIGGVPVALAYCTLCGSGILYETTVPPRQQPFVFGSSGFLYRSNKLMYDHETKSLWNQFTGRPVVGELTGSGIELKIRPVTITSWRDWLARHPDTKVLSLDTGFNRVYEPGRPYGEYFASPDLMFPAVVLDRALNPKDYVFALRVGLAEKAWRLTAFEGGKVLNDSVGEIDVVLIGNAATRTVRAYDAGGRDFEAAGDGSLRDTGDGSVWQIDEEGLIGADGTRLARLGGHIAYWFAWTGYKPQAPLADG